MLSDTIASIHWLSITIWQNPEFNVIPLIMDTLNLNVFKKRGSAAGRGYKEILFGDFEAKLYVHPYELIWGDHIHLELPGDACDAIALTAFSRLFHQLTEYNLRFQVTRLDVALDTQWFTTEQVAHDAFITRRIRTRVHRENITRTYNATGTGDTIYFGSNESDTRLRIYKKQFCEKIPLKVFDTLPEHERMVMEDERGKKYYKIHPQFKHHYFTRVELQLRDDRANFLFKAFAYAAHADWIILMASSINDFVSIQEDYWQDWLADVPQGALLAIQNPPKSIERTTKWLHHQVAASLVMYIQALAGNNENFRQEIITELFNYGMDMLGAGHKRVIEQHELVGNIERLYEFVGIDAEQNALEPVDGLLDFRPLRKDYMTKIKEYPYWYKKFMVENPQFDSARPSHFGFDLRFGGRYFDMTSPEYHAAMDVLAPKEPAAPEPIQYPLKWDNDSIRKRINHYDS